MRLRQNRVIIGVLVAVAVALSFAAVVVLHLPPYMGWLLGWSLATLAAYGIDKAQARRGRWRIPEAGLHGLAIAGGALGGVAGMLAFRHKTRNPAFVIVLAVASVVQIGVGIALSTGASQG